jgi:two-component system, NarL family, response regulator YdfI
VIRVLTVTASALLRAGLASLAEVVGSATHVEEALTFAAETHPDLMIVECDERSIRDVLISAGESPPLLLLSADPDPEWLSAALRAGVRGVIPRDAPEQEIAAAIEGAAAGLVVLHPDWVENAITRRVAGAPAAEPLSPREIDVLRLMAEGASNKTIAWKLEISEHTVKFHVNSILSKLRAGSRTEAVMLGVRRGLVPL